MTPVVDIERVRRNFARHAGEYDRFAVVQKRVVDNLLDLLCMEKRPVGNVLDVGSGTGWLTARLLERCPAVNPFVTDIAHGMTCEAREHLGCGEFVDADAQALPLRDGVFDTVVSSSAYQWVNDLPRAFAESARVLRPGGLFAFALFGGRTLFELKASYGAAAAESGRDGSAYLHDFPTPERVADALRAAGFSLLHLRSEDEIDLHPDVPSLLRSLKGIGAGNAAQNRPSGLASRRVMERMMGIYRERYGTPEGIPATYEVIYGVARPL